MQRLARIATLELLGTFNQDPLYKVYTQEAVLNPGTRMVEFFTDALVTGNILDFSFSTEERFQEIENELGEKILVMETSVNAELRLEVRAYSGADLSLIGQKTFSANFSNLYPENGEVPSELEIALGLLDKITLREFPGLFFKQDVTKYHYLLGSEEENPVFTRALELAGEGNLRAARELFAEMYQAERNLPAGYNLSLIYEAQGRITQAIQLMDELATIGFQDSQHQVDRMSRRIEVEGPYWE
jgi:tetratricopeptide (TPR) repeat protein